MHEFMLCAYGAAADTNSWLLGNKWFSLRASSSYKAIKRRMFERFPSVQEYGI